MVPERYAQSTRVVGGPRVGGGSLQVSSDTTVCFSPSAVSISNQNRKPHSPICRQRSEGYQIHRAGSRLGNRFLGEVIGGRGAGRLAFIAGMAGHPPRKAKSPPPADSLMNSRRRIVGPPWCVRSGEFTSPRRTMLASQFLRSKFRRSPTLPGGETVSPNLNPTLKAGAEPPWSASPRGAVTVQRFLLCDLCAPKG